MKRYRHISGESYLCRYCDKEYSEIEVDELEDFRCPSCEYLLIVSVSGEKFSHVIIERKLASEIIEGDDILLLEDNEYHQVLGIKDMTNDRTKFMLKGFGAHLFRNDEFINCLARMREY